MGARRQDIFQGKGIWYICRMSALYSGQYIDENETPVTTSSLRRTKTKRTVVTLVFSVIVAGVGYLLWKIFM